MNSTIRKIIDTREVSPKTPLLSSKERWAIALTAITAIGFAIVGAFAVKGYFLNKRIGFSLIGLGSGMLLVSAVLLGRKFLAKQQNRAYFRVITPTLSPELHSRYQPESLPLILYERRPSTKGPEVQLAHFQSTPLTPYMNGFTLYEDKLIIQIPSDNQVGYREISIQESSSSVKECEALWRLPSGEVRGNINMYQEGQRGTTLFQNQPLISTNGTSVNWQGLAALTIDALMFHPCNEEKEEKEALERAFPIL